MAEWWWKADLLESCNCAEFGCGCNYTSMPTHGDCKAILTWSIEEGAFGEERLDRLGLALLLTWPGAIHEGNGHAIVYVDARANEAQRAGLAAIGSGEAGAGGPFEVFATTYVEPPEVVHGPLTLEREEHDARVSLGELGEVNFEPIRDVMDGSPSLVHWVKATGFLWRDGLTVKTKVAEVRADKVSFRYEDTWGVYSQVGYNAPWPAPAITSYDD
jgi:hypothetical protein